MAYIYVNKARLQGFGGTAKQMSGKVDLVKRDFQTIGSKLDWDVKSAGDIKTTIAQITTEIEQYVMVLNKMSIFFAACYSEYSNLDSHHTPGQVTVVEPMPVTPKVQSLQDGILSWFYNGAIKADEVIKEMGGLGSVSYLFYKVISGFAKDRSHFDVLTLAGAKHTFELLRDVKGGFQKLVSLDSDMKRIGKMPTYRQPMAKYGMWKRFLGSNQYLSNPSKAANLFTRFGRNFKKAFAKELDSLVHLGEKSSAGVKSAWKYGGVAVSGVINSITNYDEYKSGQISGLRALEETFLETGIDVVKGAALVAGVGAAAAAVSISAPAWVVAGVAAGVGIGIDVAVTKCKGKCTTEWASDTILDAGEIAQKYLSSIATQGVSATRTIVAGWRTQLGY